ncbi:hypothetical protein HK101_008693 [Irineochytrium annulatum]|nr:hypothetical protein HK101_008693 [Irineochytrium annulatum]
MPKAAAASATTTERILQALQALASKDYAKKVERFFNRKYCAKDVFIGVRVPQFRSILPDFTPTVADLDVLLKDDRHEVRHTAILFLVKRYEVEDSREEAVNCYISALARVNNWDLVDSSAHKILGPWLLEKHEPELAAIEALALDLSDDPMPDTTFDSMPPWFKRIVTSNDLWEQRISIVLCLALHATHPTFVHTVCLWHIRRLHARLPITLEGEAFDDPDLLHKAVGWILREAAKKNKEARAKLLALLTRVAPICSKVTVHYALEHIDKATAKKLKTLAGFYAKKAKKEEE